MVLRFFLLAITFLFIFCSVPERDSPYDPNGINYQGGRFPSVPSSPSSSSVKPSSSSAALSSSSSKPSSSSSVPSSGSSVPTQTGVIRGTPVTYEGETYETVVIGTQTWFKRNLNYAVAGSKCGNYPYLKDTNTETCDTYGRLYYWVTAMDLDTNCNYSSCSGQINVKHRGICPNGWHIPGNADWNILMKFINPSCSDNSNSCYDGAEIKLKASSGWNKNSNGTDDYGFSALPGGYGCISGSSYCAVGENSSWWSASEYNTYDAYYLSINYSTEYVYRGNQTKDYYLHSVRCVKD